MDEIELEPQLRQQRLQEICEANQAAIEARERQARECEYLEEMGQLPERREWKLPEPRATAARARARHLTCQLVKRDRSAHCRRARLSA